MMRHGCVVSMKPPRHKPSTSLTMLCPPCALLQATLLKLAQEIFPEGQGKPNGKAKLTAAVELTNGLMVDTKKAVSELFKARGYDPRRPEYTKRQLGYPPSHPTLFLMLIVSLPITSTPRTARA